MTFDELLEAGRALKPAERKACLEGLANDPRFAAVAVLVRESWEGFARAAGDQKLAPHHGCLAHCAGSMHALLDLEGKLRAAIAAKSRRGPTPPEDGAEAG
jgi:hypothetical protein